MSKVLNIILNQVRKLFQIKRSGRSLGVAKERRQYDLPLNKGNGTLFLKILIALMTFLAILGLAFSFTLSEMTNRWSAGLENKASIEIPAQDINGAILPQETVNILTSDVSTFLKNHPAIESVEIMSVEEIAELVSPWLGENLTFDNVPLPGIISIGFKEDIEFDMKAIETRLKKIAPQAILDTHESWLKDILKFTGALNFAAVLITLVIGVTTIIAITGAVQSRMAIYHEELQLLHLMGAEDSYISRQLQRYMLILSFQGALIGTIFGGLALTIIGWLAGKMDISLLPDFTLSGAQILTLLSLPILIAFVSMFTARQTVLRVLVKMP